MGVCCSCSSKKVAQKDRKKIYANLSVQETPLTKEVGVLVKEKSLDLNKSPPKSHSKSPSPVPKLDLSKLTPQQTLSRETVENRKSVFQKRRQIGLKSLSMNTSPLPSGKPSAKVLPPILKTSYSRDLFELIPKGESNAKDRSQISQEILEKSWTSNKALLAPIDNSRFLNPFEGKSPETIVTEESQEISDESSYDFSPSNLDSMKSSPRSTLVAFKKTGTFTPSEARTEDTQKNLKLFSSLHPELTGFESAKLNSGTITTSAIQKKKLSGKRVQVNQYTLEKLLGKGAFGKVFKATDHNGSFYAVKTYNKKILRHRWIGRGKTAMYSVKAEINVMKTLDHPNALKLYEVIDNETSKKLYMVLEFAQGGTLESKCPMSEPVAKKYFEELVKGLEYLHCVSKVVHRDIKPQNILIGKNSQLKISDFGSAQSIAEGKQEFGNTAGTYAFMAPELHGGYKSFKGKPLDMWAAGITLYYMLEAKTPFKSKKLMELSEEVKSNEVTIPEEYSSGLKDLLSKLLCKNPDCRISVEETKNHPWLNN